MTEKSIAQQIASISYFLIGGLILLALIAIVGTLKVRSVFIDYRQTAQSTVQANAIFEDLFEARMAALQWRVSPGDASAEELRSNIAEVHKMEETFQSVKTGEPSAQIEIFADADRYLAQFGNILAAQSVYDATNLDLASVGKVNRERLTDIMETAYADGDVAAAFYAGRAQEALMLGRFYVERYRQSESKDELSNAQSHLARAQSEMETLLPQLQDARRIEQANAVVAGVVTYINTMRDLEQAVQARLQAGDAMDSIGPKMLGDLEQEVDLILAQQRTLGQRGDRMALWTLLLGVGLSLLIVGLGWSYARKNTKAIVNSIEESVDTMSRIADGDLDADVRNAEQETELGRMARALEVFKTNGKSAIEATQREQRLEKERQESQAAVERARQEQEAHARAQTEAARKEMLASLCASLGTVVSAASQGDFTTRVEAEFTDEELAGLADSVNALVASVDEGLCAVGTVLEHVADGDLTTQMDGVFYGAFAGLQENTNNMITSLRALVVDISASSETLASSSAELSQTSDVLSRNAEQNAASLEESSAALDELSASINQVSSNISDASSSAHIASSTAKASGKVAADAAESMNSISQASQEISQVVSVINDISFQINLLALNAGVEAARAGEAGRGFSVVASEVRQLAQRASDAAKEIRDVIIRSDDAVALGVAKVGDAQSSLTEIADSVVSISERIDQISNAVGAQVNGIGEITMAVSQIDRNTQKQAAAFEEVTAASGLLADEADELKQSMAQFRTNGSHKVVPFGAEKAPSVSETQPAAKRAV